MTQTIAQTLKALDNVGKTTVTLHLNPQVFPHHLVGASAAPYHPDVTADADGALVIQPSPQAHRVLKSFLADLLAATREQ